MKHLLLLILFYTSSISLYGQGGNSRSGYVVLVSGDTLSGQIKVESALSHAQYVSYKRQPAASWVKYYPDQIKSYYYGPSNYYVSESVPFQTNTSELDYKRLFLKKLVAGDTEIYRLDYELQERISPVYEFESTFYFLRRSASGELIDLLPVDYRSKLRSALGSPSCVFEDIGSFDDAGLSSLVLAYSECRNLNLEKVYIEKKLKKLRWGVSFGLASAELSINNNDNQGFMGGNEIGFDFNAFIVPKISQSLDLRLGVKLKSRNQPATREVIPSEVFINAGEAIELKSELNITQLLVPAHLILSRPMGRFRPYILGGGELGFSLGNSYMFEETRFTVLDEGTLLFAEERGFTIDQTDLNSLEIGWTLGLGGAFEAKNGNQIFLELQYTSSTSNNSRESPIFISQRGFSVLLGYILN
ncbi:MAG: hypothetical protein AAFY36_15595 [Bacteroidota bacterium]